MYKIVQFEVLPQPNLESRIYIYIYIKKRLYLHDQTTQNAMLFVRQELIKELTNREA